MLKCLNVKTTQRGISLYFAVIITSLLLAMALGLATILLGQIRILREMGDSVKALFAADTGMEKILYLNNFCQRDDCTSTSPFASLCQDQIVAANATSCIGLYYYSTSTSINDSEYIATASSTGQGGIFKSMGGYKKARRAIEASQ